MIIDVLGVTGYILAGVSTVLVLGTSSAPRGVGQWVHVPSVGSSVLPAGYIPGATVGTAVLFCAQ